MARRLCEMRLGKGGPERRRRWGQLLGLAAVAALAAAGCDPAAGGGGSPLPPEQAAQRSASPDEALCRRFMDLKNGHDRRANDLLGPRPQVPDRPVPADEADRLDAGLMLHQDVVILDVHPDRGGGESAGRYVFVLDGSVASERLAVRTTGGIEQRQRAMWRPDVVVEVRDGTIHPLYPRLHVD